MAPARADAERFCSRKRAGKPALTPGAQLTHGAAELLPASVSVYTGPASLGSRRMTPASRSSRRRADSIVREMRGTPRRPPEQVNGGQTGSGGIPPGFSCDQLAAGSCETSLRSAFGAEETQLTAAGSECVPASALDPALDEAPVCRCDYTRARYFSDTGGSDTVQLVVGLNQRRVALGAPSDGCEVWYRGTPSSGVCLVQSSAFAGCSLDAAASSCESACQSLSDSHGRAISTRAVEVLAATCVQCASGYCAGVVRSQGACYFGLQYSLNFGYGAASIPCEGSGEEMLSKQLDASRYSTECEVSGREPTCENSAGGACVDAGTTDSPDAGGTLTPDAGKSDAG